jgi:hypothetical protein
MDDLAQQAGRRANQKTQTGGGIHPAESRSLKGGVGGDVYTPLQAFQKNAPSRRQREGARGVPEEGMEKTTSRKKAARWFEEKTPTDSIVCAERKMFKEKTQRTRGLTIISKKRRFSA